MIRLFATISLFLLFFSYDGLGQKIRLVVHCSDGLTGKAIGPDNITVGGSTLSYNELELDKLNPSDTIIIEDEYYDFPRLTVSQYDYDLDYNTIRLHAKGAPRFYQRIIVDVPIAQKDKTVDSEVLFQVYTDHDRDHPTIQLKTRNEVVALKPDYVGEGVYEAYVFESDIDGAELTLTTDKTKIKYVCSANDWMRMIPIDMYEKYQWTDREINTLNTHFEQYASVLDQSKKRISDLEDWVEVLEQENEQLKDSILKLQEIKKDQELESYLPTPRAPREEYIVDFPDVEPRPIMGIEEFKNQIRNELQFAEIKHSGRIVVRMNINSSGDATYLIPNERAFDFEVISRLRSVLRRKWYPRESGGRRLESTVLLIIDIRKE